MSIQKEALNRIAALTTPNTVQNILQLEALKKVFPLLSSEDPQINRQACETVITLLQTEDSVKQFLELGGTQKVLSFFDTDDSLAAKFAQVLLKRKEFSTFDEKELVLPKKQGTDNSICMQ